MIETMMKHCRVMRVVTLTVTIMVVVSFGIGSDSGFAEPLIIAASPSVKVPLEALAQAFERSHPDVHVRVHYDSGLGLRQSIASMQNSGRYFIGSGPFHLIAPASGEVLDRLERRYYVLPGTRRAYASVPLVLIVPESLADAPASFEALAEDATKKVSVADAGLTELGLRTRSFLEAVGLSATLQGRLDVAHDAKGVIDDVLNGDADAGIVFGSDAIRESARVRVVATSTEKTHRPVLYSIAMERYCPNRDLCQAFLAFTQSVEAQTALQPLGYGLPSQVGSRPSP
jgi:molybdate transport system substrate-binding protein